MHRFPGFFLLCTIGCSGAASTADDSEAVTSRSKVQNFECTAIAKSATDDHLRTTRLDVTIDITPAGKPSGELVTGFEPSLHATAAIGFGTSHVRDTTVSGHQVSEYKIDFGADSILPGAKGGTLTLPTAYTHLALESSPALNVATLTFTPSNATATFKCKKDPRNFDPGPPPDPLVFEGDAKAVVAKDACAKTVAAAVMDDLIGAIEDLGLDVPDFFTFTKIDRTDSGYQTVVNGATFPVVVGPRCSVKSVDTSAARSIGE